MRCIHKYLLLCVFFSIAASSAHAQHQDQIFLKDVLILMDENETSFVRHGIEDFSAYLTEITGKKIFISSAFKHGLQAQTVIAFGRKMATASGEDVAFDGDLGKEGFILRSSKHDGKTVVVVAGADPHGTNMGIATLMQMVRIDGPSAFLEGPLNLRSTPSIAVRGLQSGGWPIKYPYAAWQEQDWKRFIDMAWLFRINRLLLSPLLETLPVPLSPEDEAYVQEVRRIVDYAQTKRGIEVWVGMPANRIAISNCGERNPRKRPYWINGCQKDFNPADPTQFAKITSTVDTFYRIINNPDGILMGDADPGGWPNSPLSEQVKIFQNARQFLDRYNIHGKQAKLADFMWIGWGRHKFFTSTDRLITGFDWSDKNPDESDIAFMAETIRNFKKNLAEPWEVWAGMTPYLESAKREAVLDKTIYFPYGAIELEPAFPSTNTNLAPVRAVVDKVEGYSNLSSLMGNNQITILQFPMTYYFFESTWNFANKKKDQLEVLSEISEQIYPEHAQLLTESLLALHESDLKTIEEARLHLETLVKNNDVGRVGSIGRYLFPDRLIVAKTLVKQLQIRAARQSLIIALRGKPTVQECARLIEDYFDKLLDWNQETGWEKVIDTGIWTQPIYEQGKDLTEGISHLKEILGEGSPYTSYAQVDSFFQEIQKRLLVKYQQNSVMIGCIQPLKSAVTQAQ